MFLADQPPILRIRNNGKPLKRNIYTEALEKVKKHPNVGNYNKIAEICGIQRGTVMHWLTLGKPPFSEYTGKTNYAGLLSKATDGEVSEESLKPSYRLLK